MPTQEEIVQQAAALGKALSELPNVQSYFAAQRAVQADSAAQAMLKGYTDAAHQMREKETTGQPIEAEEKQQLAKLEQDMATNDAIKTLMRWQADYMELMNRINQAISGPLSTALNTGNE